MNESRRKELIDSYFAALDEDNFSHVESVLAEGVQFSSSSDEVSGVDGFREYLNEDRMISNSTHKINRRFHNNDDVSVVEGTVSGETPDGPVEGAFCDVFDFDPQEGTLTNITVYTQL